MSISNGVSSCRICKKSVCPEESQYPFCSKRCRLIDLDNWASGRYITHAPLTESDEQIEVIYPTLTSI